MFHFYVALLTESVDWNPLVESYWNRWKLVALLTESVDWNFYFCKNFRWRLWSLSSRRAWIEIELSSLALASRSSCRSPHGERGLKYCIFVNLIKIKTVALLTESVDWNMVMGKPVGKQRPVALLTESVDWNLGLMASEGGRRQSLSSRRAWIEIRQQKYCKMVNWVALLTESVDWN